MTEKQTLHIPLPLPEMATALAQYVYNRDRMGGVYSPSLSITIATDGDHASVTKVTVILTQEGA